MMKKTILFSVTFICIAAILYANPNFTNQSKQVATDSVIRFDGLYVAKTGEVNIPNNKMEIYTYIRFYPDGTVYTQTVNSFDPVKVAVWLGKNGRFERKGTYKIEGSVISFSVTNDESPDKRLEGAMFNQYKGKIMGNNQLALHMKYTDGTEKDFLFEFSVVDKQK
jgi:hypothetical protein